MLLVHKSVTGKNVFHIAQECLPLCSERRAAKLYKYQNMSEPSRKALQVTFDKPALKIYLN
jgi:hypothetical protein